MKSSQYLVSQGRNATSPLMRSPKLTSSKIPKIDSKSHDVEVLKVSQAVEEQDSKTHDVEVVKVSEVTGCVDEQGQRVRFGEVAGSDMTLTPTTYTHNDNTWVFLHAGFIQTNVLFHTDTRNVRYIIVNTYARRTCASPLRS